MNEITLRVGTKFYIEGSGVEFIVEAIKTGPGDSSDSIKGVIVFKSTDEFDDDQESKE